MTITKTTNTTTRYNKQQTTRLFRVFNFGFSILLLLKKTPNSIEKFKIKLLFLKQKKKKQRLLLCHGIKLNKLGPNP